MQYLFLQFVDVMIYLLQTVKQVLSIVASWLASQTKVFTMDLHLNLAPCAACVNGILLRLM